MFKRKSLLLCSNNIMQNDIKSYLQNSKAPILPFKFPGTILKDGKKKGRNMNKRKISLLYFFIFFFTNLIFSYQDINEISYQDITSINLICWMCIMFCLGYHSITQYIHNYKARYFEVRM